MNRSFQKTLRTSASLRLRVDNSQAVAFAITEGGKDHGDTGIFKNTPCLQPSACSEFCAAGIGAGLCLTQRRGGAEDAEVLNDGARWGRDLTQKIKVNNRKGTW